MTKRGQKSGKWLILHDFPQPRSDSMIFRVWNCMMISTTCQDHVATCIQTQRPPLPAAGTQRTSCGWNVGAGRTTRTETTCSFQPTGRRL